MVDNTITLAEKLILLCLFAFFSSSFILITFSWGKYVMLLSVFLMFVIYISSHNAIIKVPKTGFFRHVIAFIAICMFSISWATSKGAAISKCITLIEICVFIAVIFICTDDFIDANKILKIIQFSAYAEALFLTLHFGLSNLLNSVSVRLTNEVGNSNYISMLMAISIIITVHDILFDSLQAYHLLSIPTVLFLAIAQSRTALIGSIVGIIMLLYFKSTNTNKLINRLFRIVCAVGFIILLFYILQKIPLFHAINERMYNVWISITGRGVLLNGERSISIRKQMIDIGLNQLKHTPIFGIGIGNSFTVLMKSIGENTYLHNNYIELAVDVGLFGAIIYYSIYIYVLKSLYRYRNCKNIEYYVCLTLVLVQLLMDYGAVSYYTKDTYFYFYLYFVEIKQLKKNAVCTLGTEQT